MKPSKCHPLPSMQRVPQKSVFGLAGLVLIAALILGCGSEAPLRMEAGVSLPEFSLPVLEGGKMSSASFGEEGQMTVLNFWATWCQPCLKEMPELSAMDQDPRLQVVGVALDEEGTASVAPFVERHGIDYPILLGNQDIFQRLGGFSIPYTLVLDTERTVLKIYRGPVTGEQLLNDLAAREDRSDPIEAASSGG